jgi:hypothetical protein
MNGSCRAASECCPGFDCRGTCCKPTQQACSAASDCCSHQCRGGKCCTDLTEACSSGADCCSGVCTGGACVCAPLGAACTDAGDCCRPAPAVFPACQTGKCCLEASQPCNADAECCSGTCRPNGVCQ